MANAIDIFLLLPDIAAIGQTQLQTYCDQWLQRPIAWEFGITHLIVGADLLLTANVDAEQVTTVGESIFIPIDELAGYVIDRHFDGEKCRELHNELRNLRSRWNEVGYVRT